MSSKRYHVIYTGKTYTHMDVNTIVSNVVLMMNITTEKANKLISGGRLLLKRFDTLAEAQSLVDRFDEAGLICGIYDSAANMQAGDSERSSILTTLKGFVSKNK